MHRGQLLKKKLDEAGVNKAEFSRRAGYKGAKSLYYAFRNPDLGPELFYVAIRHYGLSFSREIPSEFSQDKIDLMNEEFTGREKVVPLELYLDVIKRYTKELEDHKEVSKKYEQQLEDTNNLLNENIELYRKLSKTTDEPVVTGSRAETAGKKKNAKKMIQGG